MLHSNESSNVITFAMYFDRFIEHIYKISGKIPMQACNTDSSHSKFSEQNYEVFSLDKHTTHHPEHQLLNDIFGAKSIMADCSSFSFYIHHNQLFIRHSIESKKKNRPIKRMNHQFGYCFMQSQERTSYYSLNSFEHHQNNTNSVQLVVLVWCWCFSEWNLKIIKQETTIELKIFWADVS